MVTTVRMCRALAKQRWLPKAGQQVCTQHNIYYHIATAHNTPCTHTHTHTYMHTHTHAHTHAHKHTHTCTHTHTNTHTHTHAHTHKHTHTHKNTHTSVTSRSFASLPNRLSAIACLMFPCPNMEGAMLSNTCSKES